MQRHFLFFFYLLLSGYLSWGQSIQITGVSNALSCDGELDVYFTVSPAGSFAQSCYFEVYASYTVGSVGGGYLSPGGTQGTIHLSNMMPGVGQLYVGTQCAPMLLSDSVSVAVGLYSTATLLALNLWGNPALPGVCIGEGIQLHYMIAPPFNDELFTFHPLGGTPISGNQPIYLDYPAQTTTYAVSAVEAGVTGCPPISDTVTIAVYDPIYVTLLTPDTLKNCGTNTTLPLNVSVTGGSGNFTYTWSGTGMQNTFGNPGYVDQIGEHHLYVSVEDAGASSGGCQINYNNSEVHVYNYSPPVFSNVYTYYDSPLSPSDTLCPNQYAYLEYTVTGGSDWTSFSISPPLNSVSANSLNPFIPDNSSRLLMVEDLMGICPTTTYPLNTYLFQNLLTPTISNSGGTLSCNVNAPLSQCEFQWYRNDTLLNNNTHLCPATVWGTYACKVKVPPHGCEVWAYYTVGITQELSTQFMLSPNPVEQMLTILPPRTATAVQLQIYNLQAKMVQEIQTNFVADTPCKLDMGSLPEGVYWLHILADDLVGIYKLIKH